MLLVPFQNSISVESFDKCLISDDNRLLALHGKDKSIALFSLPQKAFVNGFKPLDVLFFQFVSVGTLNILVTYNGKGFLSFYRHRFGKGQGFYVRMINKSTVSNSSSADPVLVRFEDGEAEAEEEEETVYCWEVGLDRLSQVVLGKHEKIQAVKDMYVSKEGRHIVLLLDCDRVGPMALVIDVSSSLAVRRWWPLGENGRVDMDAVVGKKDEPGLNDVGPRSLGTDVMVSQEDHETSTRRRKREWLPPMTEKEEKEEEKRKQEMVAPCPAGTMEVFCDGGRKRLFLGDKGLYLPILDQQKLLRATLIFEGADAALSVAEANQWEADDVRFFALELAFRHGDVITARRVLYELPTSMRKHAHELANEFFDRMDWDLLQTWSSVCACWASQDGDEEAAEAVKRVRLLAKSRREAVSVASVSATPKSGAKRSLAFAADDEVIMPNASVAPNTASWKPAKATRIAWDGKADEVIAKLACLSGRLSEGAAFIRWRSGATNFSILQLAKEAAFQSLCKGNLEEARTMIANCGTENVDAVIEDVRVSTVRPSVRKVTGGFKAEEDEAWVEEIFEAYNGVCGVVDDHPMASRWFNEEREAKEQTPSKPRLRASIKWVKQWGQRMGRDVLLDALVTHQGIVAPSAPSWDPHNIQLFSYYCRHGNERAARKFCHPKEGKFEIGGEALAEMAEALKGAPPHVLNAVLLECAKAGIHPMGVNYRIACSVGSMLGIDEVSSSCVRIACKYQRVAMFHTLLDAGACIPDDLELNPWNNYSKEVRKDDALVSEMSRMCAALVYGVEGDAGLHKLGRPLISIAHDLYNNKVPRKQELEELGCLDMDVSFASLKSSFDVSSLIPRGIGERMPCSRGRYDNPSREDWLARDMPFHAFQCDSRLADCFAKHYVRVRAAPKDDWVAELVESSLDPERPVSVDNRHVMMVVENKETPPPLSQDYAKEIPVTSALERTFERAWIQLRQRKEAYELAGYDESLTDERAMELLDLSLENETTWDVGHLLHALDEGRGGQFSKFRRNWAAISKYSLDKSLLHASTKEMGDVLRKQGLWDAARQYDEEHRDSTTLLQATEQLQPNWQKISDLFEAMKLPKALREQFWIEKATEFEDSDNLALLALARQSCDSETLEVRYLLADCGGTSWKTYQEKTEEEKEILLQSICGVLAKKGEMDEATKLCRSLSLFPPVMEVAQKKFESVEELEPFLQGKYGSSWKDWAQGRVLRMRAQVNDSVSPDVVTATLAGEGQIALAREWAIHFKPEPKKLSRSLGMRYVEALKHHYPNNSHPSSMVSLASPSGRALSSPGIDICWSDGAWADYVAVGGSPSDVGDLLYDSLCAENTQIVRSVELCVRAHACYAMACNLEGMEKIIRKAEILANMLANAGLYQHLVRLVTGMGNYVRLEFCFGILLEAEQFELILRKNPMMSYGARLDLRASLFSYLKKHKPRDSRSLNLVMLSFGMFREMGESLEEQAHELIKQVQQSKSNAVLLKILTCLIDASDSYHKDRCLQKAEKALSMARLVTLQIKQPSLKLLYDNGADISKLSSFSDACVVATALGLPKDWWLDVAYQQVVVNGNMQYFESLMTKKLQSMPISEFFHDFLSLCRKNNAPTQVLSNVVKQCKDIFLAFDLCMEFQIQSLIDELAMQHSSIRSFKLLNNQLSLKKM